MANCKQRLSLFAIPPAAGTVIETLPAARAADSVFNIEQEVNMKKFLSVCLLSASAVAFAEVQQIGDEGMKTLGTDFV